MASPDYLGRMDPVALTRELVEIPSSTGDEGRIGDFLDRKLSNLGYGVTRQEVAPGRWNVYAWRDPPVVVLSTHMDTVPPVLPIREDDANLYGRGTCDAKGLMAAQIAAAEDLAARGERRVALLFLVGEEYGSDGARAAAHLQPKGRFLINGEPTGNLLALGHKGALYARLTARGRAAHSAYPEEGDSAIEAILAALNRIRQVPLPEDDVLGPSTVNIGTIQGGVRPNVIPDACRAELLVRTVSDTTELKRALTAAAGSGVQVEFAWELAHARFRAIPGFATTVVRFTTDVPYLTAWGEPFLLGPGSIDVAHTDREHVRKQDIREGSTLYQRLVTTLLNSDGPNS